MYYAIVKLVFDIDTTTKADHSEFYKVTNKIKSRFKISVLSSLEIAKRTNSYYIVFAILDKTPQSISAKIDKIISICEEQGIGRIISEKSVLDHIETLF